MLPSFARESVTIKRAPYVEQRGTRVRDWSGTITSTTVTGCHVQPLSSSTAWTDLAQSVTTDALLFLPPGTDIQPDDRIEHDGVLYAVQGAPKAWKSPTGAIDHVEAELVRWSL